MTTLDQAFIKAFAQQGASSTVAARQPVAPEPEAAAPQLEKRPATKPLRSPLSDYGARVAPLPVSNAFALSLELMENPPLPPAPMHPTPAVEDRPADLGWEAPSLVGAEEFAGATQCLDITECFEPSVALPSTWATGDESATAVEDWPESQPAAEPAVEKVVEPVAERKLSLAVPSIEEVARPPLTVAPAAPQFKPAWQVDCFTWPKVCRRLVAQASEEFDRLADALSAAVARGQKVLAVGGCCRGEGATTLLLCAARQLAERGVHLALVDADFSRPRLAKRLGIEPQRGWNETAEEDGTFLGYAVIEAVSNNLALAPIRESAVSNSPSASDWARLASCLEALKNHYEMVLVDLGPLENIEAVDDLTIRMGNGQIDAVLLVHNGRITSDERLAEVQNQLTTADIVLAGVIENFVAA